MLVIADVVVHSRHHSGCCLCLLLCFMQVVYLHSYVRYCTSEHHLLYLIVQPVTQ